MRLPLRLLLFIFFIGAALSAPQGYNYQLQIGDDNFGELTLEQLQVLQQFIEQNQEQSDLDPQQEILQPLEQPEQLQDGITIADTTSPEEESLLQSTIGEQDSDSDGYEIANQLAQQAQQLVQYEQDESAVEQIQQQPDEGPSQPVEIDIRIADIQKPEVIEANYRPETLSDEIQYPPLEAKSPNVQPQQVYIPPQSPQSPQSPQTPSPLPPQSPLPQTLYQSVQQQRSQQPSVEYNKNFYYLSAPEEDVEPLRSLEQDIAKVRKNLRVIFIRSPEQNGLSDALVQLTKESGDSRTAIYVLSKQQDARELSQKWQQARNSVSHKPEVIFVKYKTPQDAAHAQRSIQAQYETFNGPSRYNNEGVAPIKIIPGIVESTDTISANTRPQQAAPASPADKYLPAVGKH